MTLEEALAIIEAATGVDRYRALCDPSNAAYRPDYPAYVIAKATALHEADMRGVHPSEGPRMDTQPPSLPRQAASLAGAIVRAGAAVLTGQPVLVDDATYEARLDVCRTCEHFQPEPMRCRKCGCYEKFGKMRLQTEACPIGKW